MKPRQPLGGRTSATRQGANSGREIALKDERVARPMMVRPFSPRRGAFVVGEGRAQGPSLCKRRGHLLQDVIAPPLLGAEWAGEKHEHDIHE